MSIVLVCSCLLKCTGPFFGCLSVYVVLFCCFLLRYTGLFCTFLWMFVYWCLQVSSIARHPHTYTHALQHTATCSNTLQHTTTHCNTLLVVKSRYIGLSCEDRRSFFADVLGTHIYAHKDPRLNPHIHTQTLMLTSLFLAFFLSTTCVRVNMGHEADE